mmetsp:Transcript_4724/g.8373  ORF Transcript_4724/g.8373 Transcript_4724/m.8373 type:complete len:510 (+) Transcript_4724:160-1689(+)
MRSISVKEIGQHGPTAAEKWVIVEGEVFDVSSFAAFHPGGQRLLEEYAGKDASEEFALYHHDGVMRKYREKLMIGKVEGYVKPRPQVVPYGDPAWCQGFNSPYYKPTHIKLRDRVRKFVDEELMPGLDSWANGKKPDAKIMERMGKEGFLACLTGSKEFPAKYVDAGTPIPEDFDAFHEFIVLDELARCGRGDVMAAITNGPSIALSAVMAYGTDVLKDAIAKEVLMGREFIALAVSEPWAGSDVAGLKTSAVLSGGDYLVSGVKKWITNSSYARYLVTAVVTNTNGPAAAGTSLILIDRKQAGDSISVREIGLRSHIAGTSYLEFDQVRVPAENIIGKMNHGFVPIMENFNHERVYVSTICNRLARVCVEECFKFAQKRKTFGKPIVNHDTIKIMLAQMSCRVEQQHAWLESVVYQVCTMSKAEANAHLGGTICGIKAQAAEVLEECSSLTTHIFGGNALDSKSVGRKIEPMFDGVKGYAIPAGATKVMELQMTKLALKRAKMLSAKI